MGTAAASAGAAGPSEGLRPGRSSGRTKPEYTAASGRRDHATFGSGPTCQSDDRDSEPYYLLRPMMHGPGGILLDYNAFLLRAQVTEYTVETQHSKEIAATSSSQQVDVSFESAINKGCSFG